VEVHALMDFGGNFFSVSLKQVRETIGRFRGSHEVYTLSPPQNGGWTRIATNLNPAAEYEIVVLKKTEPKMKELFSKFHKVIVHSIRLVGRHAILGERITPRLVRSSTEALMYPHGWIELIGDSDVCGFGIDGEISRGSNILSMDGECEDCDGGWGAMLARLLLEGTNAYACTGWSGKGIASNAPMCGSECLPELWLKHYVSGYGDPHLVAIMAGGNDFYNGNIPPKGRFVKSYLNFLSLIRKIRGKNVPIVLFQCGPTCSSSAGSPSRHPKDDRANVSACAILNEYMQLIATAAGGEKAKIYYCQINDVLLELPDDFAIMMHWSRSGQAKIAARMAKFILDKQIVYWLHVTRNTVNF
jgi:lysophospholipase L1-like esterase